MKPRYVLAALILLASAHAVAQPPFGPPPAQPQRPPREMAPVDLSGTWVAPVMEDWRWRMVTPLKGDSASIPLLPSAREIVESWDPARDEAEGLQCKAFGAASLMRLPGRIKVRWEDENTLSIEKDYGMQTRILYFDSPAIGPPSLQGHSVAHWDRGIEGLGIGLGAAERVGARSKTLIVETSNLLPGYLRKNGIPYSDKTTVTEYFDTFTAIDGSNWFTITTIVEDPVHLAVPFVTTTDYKLEPDDSRWNPEPCSAY